MTGDTQAIIRIVLVLPAPLGPRKPKLSPGATSKSMASTAVKTPNRLVSPRAWMSGGARSARASVPDGTQRLRPGAGQASGAGTSATSPAWTILSNWRHITTTRIADPTNPNQNGAVIPYSRASQPPIGVPTTMPAIDAHVVHARHPAQQLVGHRALADGGRGRSPDEGVRPEHDERRERHGRQSS